MVIIPEFENWLAGEDGHIYHKKGTRAFYYYKEDGRKSVRLWHKKNKYYSYLKVARLICSTYHGEPGYEPNHVNHKDGDRTNDRPDNLEWTTPSENIKHAFEHNLISKVNGSNHPASKATEEQAETILKLKIEGKSYNEIVKVVDLKRDLVRKIATGRTWKRMYEKYADQLPQYNYLGKWAGENIKLIAHEREVYPVEMVARKYQTRRNDIRNISFLYFLQNPKDDILVQELRKSYHQFCDMYVGTLNTKRMEQLLNL